MFSMPEALQFSVW